MGKRAVLTALSVVLSFQTLFAVPDSPLESGLGSITEERSRFYVETLAGDRFGGRAADTPDLNAAAKKIANWIAETGAVPFEGRSYYHKFSEAQVRDLGVMHIFMGSMKVRNILAMIEGEIPDEYVFVGAHYDHVGTIKNSETEDDIHNGADDNASGVAGALQIAHGFAASGIKPRRTVVFAFWDAEEKGLVGSECFGKTFTGMDRVRACVNLDMIGRDDSGSGGQVLFFSTDSVAWQRFASEDVATHSLGVETVTDPETLVRDFEQILVRTRRDRYAPTEIALPGNSDYAVFQSAGVPVYMVSTGLHADYHGPDDEADRIDYRKMTEISKLSFLTVYRLANEP